MTTSNALSTSSAAELLNVSRYAIYRLVKAGQLTATKLSGATGALVFDRAQVEALAAERAKGGALK